ncbi:hypothetical protein ES703_86895 [subsurface metagenome]
MADEQHSGFEALGRISQKSATISAVGPTNNYDVSGINVLFIDTTGNSVTIGGFIGGVVGQILHIIKTDETGGNFARLEDQEGTGNQDIFLHAGGDETLLAKYGGWCLICDGSNWYDQSHAKYV